MASPSLHSCKVLQPQAAIARAHIFFHLAAILTLLYYRFSVLFRGQNVAVLPWAFVTISELIISFVWFLSQSFRWRPVTRRVYPENLPRDSELPGVDLFICTADPKKEPTVEVMNTVLSAMALDYPPEKLAVYLSDDGGSAVTLAAIKEASVFGRAWLPFCRKYGIKTRCPEAYFSSLADDERLARSEEFAGDERDIKSKYELFKINVEKAVASLGDASNSITLDRAPHVEIIHDNRKDGENQDNKTKMPLLVYVSRERSPHYPHRFKAGALNALLRVSGIISNGSYFLVLDCDMYCNDPTSARQAMCFHLDPHKSPSLAFVQYPQIFYNVSKNDIYDGQARSAYKTKWQGMDGLRGTVLTGTGYYMKRKAMFGSPKHEDENLHAPEKNFGFSSQFIASLDGEGETYVAAKDLSSDEILQEAKYLATCAFEKNTKWGQEIGFLYACLLESTFGGYILQCKGWTSVYLYPERPCFLGCTTIDMKDALVQLMKWSSGLFQVAMSRFCPLTYGVSRMSILQSMCYGYFMFTPLLSVALVIYGIAPQLCLFNGIPLFPKVSDPWFAVFVVCHVSSLCQHLFEVLSSDGTVRTMWNEQRIWVIKTVSASLFGLLDVLLKWVGIQKASFRLTNKVVDKDKLEKYEQGKFNFEGAATFMVPLTMLVIFNLVCFVGGMRRVIIEKNIGEMFTQVYLSSLLLVMSYPIFEGLITRRNK
ncbi:cellulose synthase-like protein G2 [Malania oleifera]|uniref:cellulose synthase-like protein G2 n=1 Tax=Malania oleifera TaxID=397392 RepID=UPI0025ADB77C|nr:cellulose synthase-like protein G2 [Malania oleifera]